MSLRTVPRHAVALFLWVAASVGCRHDPPASTLPPRADAVSPATTTSRPPVASASPAPPQRGTEADAPQLLALIDGLTTRVAALRQLPILTPIARGVMGRREILARLRERVTEEYPPGEVTLEGEILHRLGMLPEGMDYESTVFALLEEQVAGFYDPDARRLFVADWVPAPMQTVTMAHEIVHALQDQHFHIAHVTHHQAGASDAQTAAMAVIEGDATLAMLEFVMAPLGRSVRDIGDPEQLFRAQVMDTSGQPRMAAAPRALRDTLLFPYHYGFVLCAEQYRTGGFAAIDALLSRLPDSTEQVLHADKLAAREPPIAVAASIPASLATDYVMLDDDVMGEIGARMYLQTTLDDATAESAAAGWGGDRVVLLAPRRSGAVPHGGDAGTTLPPGALAESALVWTVVFDPAAQGASDGEARAFEVAAVRGLGARYPQGVVRSVPGVSRVVETASGVAAAVGRAGRTVVVVDRIPSDRVGAVLHEALAHGPR